MQPKKRRTHNAARTFGVRYFYKHQKQSGPKNVVKRVRPLDLCLAERKTMFRRVSVQLYAGCSSKPHRKLTAVRLFI